MPRTRAPSRPSPGQVTDFHAPGGLGVRLDSALYTGYAIPPYYDSLAGKLIVHGRDRAECIARLKRSLGEMVVAGVETTIPLFQDLLVDPDILAGNYNIHWLEEVDRAGARDSRPKVLPQAAGGCKGGDHAQALGATELQPTLRL